MKTNKNMLSSAAAQFAGIVASSNQNLKQEIKEEVRVECGALLEEMDDKC